MRREPSSALRRLCSLAALSLLAAGLAAPALAQPGPTLAAQAALPDGRTARVTTFGDGLGYRLDIDGGLWSGMRDGEPENLVIGDVDGDSLIDVSVVLAPIDGVGQRSADVWDVSLQGPMLMHVSGAITTAEPAFTQLQREVTGRFAVAAGLAALAFADDAIERASESGNWTGVENQAANWIAITEGALHYAAVARARDALAAATPDREDAALETLRAALADRARFAAAKSAEIYD